MDAESTRSVPPTKQRLHFPRIQQFSGDVHAVRNHLQALLILDLAGYLQGRRSGVKNDGFAIVDEGSRNRADTPLLFRVGLQALVHRRFAQNRVWKDCAPVGTQYQPALVQFIQIVAD